MMATRCAALRPASPHLSRARSPSLPVDNFSTVMHTIPEADECVGCNAPGDTLSILKPCSHAICKICIASCLPEDELPQNVKLATCPRCHGPIEYFDPPGNIDSLMLLNSAKSSEQGSPPPRLRRRFSNKDAPLGVIRISNYPWTTRAGDLEAFVGSLTGRAHAHILQNRLARDGRTNSSAFVECADSRSTVAQVAEQLNGQLFLGRSIAVYPSTQQEMLEQIFPSWLPGWTGQWPSFLHGGESYKGHFVEASELKGLMELCKLQSLVAQRTPERPFLQFATILEKLPWRQRHLYTEEFRNSMMRHAQHALKMLLTSASLQFAHWPVIANRLATSIFECPASTVVDIDGVRRLIDCYWPSPAVALPQLPHNQPRTLPMPFPLTITSYPHPSTMPLSMGLPGLPGGRGSFEPPVLTYEHDFKMRRTSSIEPYATIAAEFGIEDALVRAIAHRLNFN